MKKTFKRLWSNEFIQGGFFVTISSFIVNILNYFFNLLAGRALGPSGFGEVTALLSYMTIFSVPMNVITLIIIEKLGAKGQDRFTYAQAIKTWFTSKLKKWWTLSIIVLALIPFIPRVTNLSAFSAFALIPLISLLFFASFYSSLAQGLRLFLKLSMIGVTVVLIKLLGPILVILGVDGLNTIVIFLLVSSIASLLAYNHITSKSHKENHLKQNIIHKRILSTVINKQFVLVFLSVLSIVVLNNVDIIFVKKFLSSGSAGIYAAWSLFAKIILYAIGPIISVGYIFFTSKESELYQKRALNLSLFILGIIAFASYFIYTHFSSFIIELFFGSKFNAVDPYLGAASIFGSLYTGIFFINNYFVAKKDKNALILPVTIPIYLLVLFFIEKKIDSIILLNISFSALVFLVYLIAYMRRFSYNNADGKQKG